MATIKDLKDLDLSKVKTPALSEQIEKLIKGYDAEKEKEDKELFIEINQKFIDKFFAMTGKNYPDALKKTVKKPAPKAPKKEVVKIPDDDLRDLAEKALNKLTDLGIDLEGEDEDLIAAIRLDMEEALKEPTLKPKIKKVVQDYKEAEPQISDTEVKKLIGQTMKDLAKAVGVQMPRRKPDDKKADATKSKEILKELEKLEPEIAECNKKISNYRRKKREAEGPKPKKSRYTLLKERLLSLVSLIPGKLKDDRKTLDKTERILLNTHRELVSAWGMGKVKAKYGADAIKDKFDTMEEKAEKKKAPADKKKAPKEVHSSESLRVEMTYQDAANYKTHFTHEIDLAEFPKAKTLKAGDQITMGDYGTLKQKDFFNSRIHPHPYDVEEDHNLLDIDKITKN